MGVAHMSMVSCDYAVNDVLCRWVFKQIYEKGLVYRGFKVCRLRLKLFLCMELLVE